MAESLVCGYSDLQGYNDNKWLVLQVHYNDVGEKGSLSVGDKYDLNFFFFKKGRIKLNGISAAEESHDLAAICLLVGLKVGE